LRNFGEDARRLRFFRDEVPMAETMQDLEHLERFLASINGYGETRTSIVFSTPIPRRGLVPPGASRAQEQRSR